MAQKTHKKKALVGNTERSTRARWWIFTWNNPPNDWNNVLKSSFNDCEQYIWQPEMGNNTKTFHIQGYLGYKNPIALTTLVKKCNGPHYEKTRSKKAIDYCQKTETRVGETISKGFKVPKKQKINVFRPWQQSIHNILVEEPDDRTIYWIYDWKGNQGKTVFCQHIYRTLPRVLYIDGKAADMKYGIASYIEDMKEDPRIIFIDITRSLEGYVSYTGIEAIKNGIFYSTKYKSKMVDIDNPHVFVFANFLPDFNALSSDRWEIIDISERKLVEET